jgi:histidyl-tRNA synthetase
VIALDAPVRYQPDHSQIDVPSTAMADKKKETNRLKARLPRGFADRGAAEIAATRQMIETIRQVYERYGFEPVETPAIEYTDALGKFLPDQDRPNEGVFSFRDDDEQWLSLRYDLTAPLARYVAENFDSLPKPYRSYRVGWVFRNEKPGPGRFRQFMQFDADTVGSSSPAADAEMCMMAADTMEALGIRRGDYVVKVNSRKLLDGALQASSVPEDKRLTALRAIDKLDRLGVSGVKALLGQGREDGSGDYTTGAQLTDNQINPLLELFAQQPSSQLQPMIDHGQPTVTYRLGMPGVTFPLPNNRQTLEFIGTQPFRVNAIYAEGVSELEAICKIFDSAGYSSDRILIDPSVVRGLEYYTGPVFEVDLTFPIKAEDGKPIRFGSVGAGGRYDGLVSRFRGQPVPATGFSIGVSRLSAALQHLGTIDTRPMLGPVIVTVFDRERIADYQAMVTSLRNAGIRAELYLGNPRNFGNQLKYADQRNAPCVIIQGSEEKARGEIQIKDLIAGTEAAIFHDAFGTSREEYLQSRLAQFSVLEEHLVEAVRKVLARHGPALR